MNSYYYLSLGSNLNPTTNMTTALHTLTQTFQHLLVWPVVATTPTAITTTNGFLNTLVVVHSAWPPEQLKHWLNTVEEQQGRDRSDPARSHKDRPIDLDIQAQQSELDLSLTACFQAPYLQAVLAAAAPDSTAPTQQLQLGHAWLGDRPAAVDTHRHTGEILIRQDSLNRLSDRFKATFSG